MNKLFLLVAFFILTISTNAQVSFKAKISSDKVQLGETFEISYIIISKGSINYFSDSNEPSFPVFNDFIELGTSQSSSVNIINNQSNSETVYTKTLRAKKVGVFRIPKTNLNGRKDIFCNELKITVINSVNNNNLQNQSNQTLPQTSTNNSQLPNTFLKWQVSKSNPYINEGVTLSLKIFTKEVDNINNIQAINPPKFNDLTSHLIKNEQKEFQYEIEKINGEEYGSVILQEWIIFPQTDQEIIISPASIEIIKYSTFFNDDLVTLSSDPIKLNPKKLPETSLSTFYGAVGNFKIISFLEKNKLKKGETTSYDIEIIGNGNLDLIKLPEIKLNTDLEVFSPKEKQNFLVTKNGLKGKITSSYLLVPQKQGKIKLTPVLFTYFDPEEEQYKTISTNENILEVNGEKNIQKFNTKSSTNEINLIDKINGNLVLAVILILLLIYAIYKFYFLSQAKKTTEKTKVAPIKEEEKINKIEVNINDKINELNKLVKENNADEFYQKQETFLNEWIEQKTQLPRNKITEHSIKEFFNKKGYNDLQIKELGNLIHTAKEAKYAPKLNKLVVNLEEELSKMISILEKF